MPSSVLLRCTSEAPVCLREDGMLWGVEAGRLVLGVDAEAVPSSVRDVTQRGVGVWGKTKSVANRTVLFVADGFWEWTSQGWPQVFSCNLLMGFVCGSLRGVLKCFLATRWFTACFFNVPLYRCRARLYICMLY